MNTIIFNQKVTTRLQLSFKKYPLSILLFLMLPLIAHASWGDSTKYLTLKDTLFITLDEKSNEKIYQHKIIKGQNLYSLARF